MTGLVKERNMHEANLKNNMLKSKPIALLNAIIKIQATIHEDISFGFGTFHFALILRTVRFLGLKFIDFVKIQMGDFQSIGDQHGEMFKKQNHSIDSVKE